MKGIITMCLKDLVVEKFASVYIRPQGPSLRKAVFSYVYEGRRVSAYRPPKAGPAYQPPQTGPQYQAPQAGPAFQPVKDGPAFQPPKDGPAFQPPR